jgi:hypothetical protein
MSPAGRALLGSVMGALVLGALGFGLLSGEGWRAPISYLAAAGISGALLFGGIAAVRLFATEAPGLSLVIAMTTYLTTIGVFGAVLAAARPDVLYGPGFAAGLILMVVASTIQQWRVNRVPTYDGLPNAPLVGPLDPDWDADSDSGWGADPR